MSLYPSLEDMQVDKMIQNQKALLQGIMTEPSSQVGATRPSPALAEVYPALSNFLGLELSDEMIRQNMPEYTTSAIQPANNQIVAAPRPHGQLVAPVTQNALIPACAQVTHNIREFILCKDQRGKVGMRVQSIDTGIFVCIVLKNSPAALAGVRFGDQILQLNGTLVSGFSVDKIHKMLKKSDKNNISIVVRDRPFERTVTLLKNAKGDLGFQFKNGKICTITKDSSAARNGVLINHNLLEVNGQTVVAMKDKDITKIINESPDTTVKITIIPAFIYDHLVKKLSTSFLRGIMDHSIPDF